MSFVISLLSFNDNVLCKFGIFLRRASEGGWSVFDMNTSPVEWEVARLREANLTSSEIQLLK